VALGDKVGRRGPSMGKKEAKKLDEHKDELAEQASQAVNLEVGDFVAELATAIRFRERGGHPLRHGRGDVACERLFSHHN